MYENFPTGKRIDSDSKYSYKMNRTKRPQKKLRSNGMKHLECDPRSCE